MQKPSSGAFELDEKIEVQIRFNKPILEICPDSLFLVKAKDTTAIVLDFRINENRTKSKL